MTRILLLVFGVLATLGLARAIARNPPHLADILPRFATSTFPVYRTPQSSIPVTRSRGGKIEQVVPSGPASSLEGEHLSPYYGKVRISSVTRPSLTTFPGSQRIEAVTVSAVGLSSQDTPATITGWSIATEDNVVVIPRGVETIYIDRPGTPRDVILRNGEQAMIIAGISPLGENFRVNKCLGWLAKPYDIRPQIFESCPAIPESELVGISGECRERVRFAANSCSVPTLPLHLQSNEDCVTWVNRHLNYGSCLREHQEDKDFLKNEWRLHVRLTTSFVDPQHDTVILRDRSGLLVDRYTY